MAVPYTFGSATSSIPLSQLDSNFATAITLGNTAVYLGNTTTTLNGLTLSNVTISSGNVTITSVTLANANITGTTTLSGLTASTALALDASKNIVSVTNTGTGNNVLAASPTLSGTVTIATLNLTNALGTAYGGTGLTSYTANGVLYASSTSALTSGSALTFDGTSLGMGSPTVYGTRSLNSYTGTTASAIGFSQQISGFGDLFLGSNNSGSSVLGMATGTFGQSTPNNIPWTVSTYGSEQMRLTSTGLGIGTSSPSAKLDLSNTSRIKFNVTSTTNAIEYWKDATPSFAASTGTGTATGLASAYKVDIFNGSTWATATTIDSSGNLGLGVTPSAWSAFVGLQVGALGGLNFGGSIDDNFVGSNVYYNAGFKFARPTTATYATMYRQAGGVHSWQVSTASGTAGNAITFTQAMTLDASGQLGIGTTSPAGVFHATNGASPASRIIIGGGGGAANTLYTVLSGGNNIQFETNGSERARIDSSGNLLVGTTSVIGSSTTQYTGTSQAVVAGYASNASFANAVVLARMAGSSTSAQLFIGQNNNSSAVFYARGDGAIFSTSTSITAISDQTLKTNVRNLDTGLSEVLALKPRRFDWLEGEGQNTKDVAGFVAQEVEQVLPELVDDYIYKVDEENGNVIKKSLKMGDMLPTLVKAIQEQQAIIDSLKARLDAANL